MTVLAGLNEIKSLDDLSQHASASDPRAESYPTGAQVSEEELWQLRQAVLDVAIRHGFPARLGARGEAALNFDREVSVVLLERMGILPADAGTEGVWSFLTLRLLPDVAFWRWPNPKQIPDYERLIGRPRNAFRRLWWRAYCLGPEASLAVFEDEAVAIMERPTLGGDPRLARAIAQTQLELVRRRPAAPRTELLRQIAKRMRRLSVIRTFGALDDDELLALVKAVAEEALVAILQTGPRVPAKHIDARRRCR